MKHGRGLWEGRAPRHSRQSLAVRQKQVATEQERQLFASKVLAAVGREAVRLPESTITGFMAMRGCLFAHALMVVGRAVNGWDKGVLPENLASHAAAERYSHNVLDSVNRGEPCPMRWVTNNWGNTKGYNTKKSAFWRTIRGVVARLEIADVEQGSWSSHLVWSDLYKIAPAAGGNPGKTLRQIQLPGCRELFNLELTTYTPSRLLLLTGTGWASPFLPDFDGTPQDVAGFCYVKRFGPLTIAPGRQPIRYVVAAHPERKPGDQWVAEVCSAFNR